MGGGPAPYAAWASRDRSAAADAALQPGAAASSSNLYQVAFSARQRRATRRQADGGTDRDGFIDQHGIRAGTPDLRVIVLDGDGSILMNLGSLATDRACGVTNLVHIIWDNGGWEITGGLTLWDRSEGGGGGCGCGFGSNGNKLRICVDSPVKKGALPRFR